MSLLKIGFCSCACTVLMFLLTLVLAVVESAPRCFRGRKKALLAVESAEGSAPPLQGLVQMILTIGEMILWLFLHGTGLWWCMEQLDFRIRVGMSACTNFDAIFQQVGSSGITTSSQILTSF